jgi:acetyl esterase/lipase
MMRFYSRCLAICLLAFNVTPALSATFLDVPYGSHERQIFDLWTPDEAKASPLVIFIHGGGWVAGTKDEMRSRISLIREYNRRGIAVAAINYRYLTHAPLQTILREDIGGFVQWMRLNSEKYRLDPMSFFAYGISAGASASLWLATHDDLADPRAEDLKLRQSTRLLAAGHFQGQISYDYEVWKQHLGKELTEKFIGSQAWTRYHFSGPEELFTEEGVKVRRDLDMYGNLTSDDPPILFWNNLENDPSRDQNYFVHSPRHGQLLHAKAKTVGVESVGLFSADGTRLRELHITIQDFFQNILDKAQGASRR